MVSLVRQARWLLCGIQVVHIWVSPCDPFLLTHMLIFFLCYPFAKVMQLRVCWEYISNRKWRRARESDAKTGRETGRDAHRGTRTDKEEKRPKSMFRRKPNKPEAKKKVRMETRTVLSPCIPSSIEVLYLVPFLKYSDTIHSTVVLSFLYIWNIKEWSDTNMYYDTILFNHAADKHANKINYFLCIIRKVAWVRQVISRDLNTFQRLGMESFP